MGLFGWHQCRKPGCDQHLFVPIFAQESDPARWAAYLAEAATWHVPGDGDWSQTRCPEHKHEIGRGGVS